MHTVNNLTTPEEVLEKVFGYQNFRTNQKEIIDSILNKNDTLVILPTGAGKSICFQIPALLFDGVTLVISPLISLMKDQVDTLQKRKVAAVALNSSLSQSNQTQILQKLSQNQIKIIYVSPERLQSKPFLTAVKEQHISLLVVDEAHCISQWGDSFRPEYKQIAEFCQKIQSKPVKLAFTATATKETQTDICQSIPLESAKKFTLMSQKDNLKINIHSVHSETFKLLLLFRLLKKHKNQSGIIFCSTRSMTKKLKQYLNLFKIQCDSYHGKMNTAEKQLVQEKFITQDPSVVIATNAFGMGIDKSNIRFVIHYQVPGSIEDFYQEIGRAGRDQKNASSYLLFTKSDTQIIKQLSKNNLKKQKQFTQFKQLINSANCRSQDILSYFGTDSDECLKCDNCALSSSKQKPKKNLELYVEAKEKLLIQKTLQQIHTSNTDHKTSPFTDLVVALLAALEPKNQQQLLAIPGIGPEMISQWQSVFKHINT